MGYKNVWGITKLYLDQSTSNENPSEELDPSRNLFEASDLPLTTVTEQPTIRSSAASSPARPSTTLSDDLISLDEWTCISDPQRIGQALDEIRTDIRPGLWNVLRKMKALISDTAYRTSKLENQMGPRLGEVDYLMKDLESPNHYHRFASVQENLLGLRNQTKIIKMGLTNRVTELEKAILSSPNTDPTQNTLNACPTAINELSSKVAELKNLFAGKTAKEEDLEKKVKALESKLISLKHSWDHTAVMTAKVEKDVTSLSESRRFDGVAIHNLKSAVAKLNSGSSTIKKLDKEGLEARIDLLAASMEAVKDEMKLNLADSKLNNWLVTKVKALWETPDFQTKIKNLFKGEMAGFRLGLDHMSDRFQGALVDILREDITKEVVKAFDANLDRFRRLCQEGMLKESDLPSTFNMIEAKESLRLTLSTDIKERMTILSSTVTQVCDQIKKIMTTDVGVHESESRLMDIIFSSNLLVRFFSELSSSDQGLGKLVDDLRVWERSAPITRLDALNALIISIKSIEKPVFANKVIALLKTGLPTKVDGLIESLESMAIKDLGDLSRVPLSDWSEYAPKSVVEEGLSDSTVNNPQPIRTSSVLTASTQEKSTTTRQTIEMLKKKLEEASTTCSKSL